MAAEEKTQQPEKHAGGRPSCYCEKYAEQVYKLALLGATDKELADFFEVCEDTINNWKKAFPEFFVSIKRGKIQADSEVAEKLFHRAKGYSHPETKVFCHEGEITTHDVTKHYPPDTGAAFIWLKNRRKWTDRTDLTTDGEKIQPQSVDFMNLLDHIKARKTEEDKPKDNVDSQ